MRRSVGKSSATARRAFAMLDIIAGIMIVGAVSYAMVLAVTGQNRVSGRLAESRSAMRQAEQVLLDLQTGRAITADGPVVRMRQLAEGEAPAGYAWVRVDVKQGRAQAELVGLAPAGVVELPEKGGRP